MKQLFLALYSVLALAAPARAADRLACAVGGIVKACPAGANLASGQKVAIGALPTGTSGSTVPLGNDARICPVSTAAGDTYYGTGSACAVLVGGSTHRLMHSNTGAAPTWGLVDLTADVSGTLPVTNGGTGAATLPSHGVLLGNSTSAVAASAAGTSGQVFTSGGAGADGAYAAPVTANSGESVLSSSPYAITGANGTWNDIGLSKSLSVGTHFCSANIRSVLNATVGANAAIELRLYDVTNAAVIANSYRMGAYSATTSVFYQATTPITKVITVAGTTTIRVEAASFTGSTYSTRAVYNDADGGTTLVCFQTAP